VYLIMPTLYMITVYMIILYSRPILNDKKLQVVITEQRFIKDVNDYYVH
jgi:hypothetical protein